jgi:hypothetical protein
MPSDNQAIASMAASGMISNASGFPNPWLDLSSQFAPQTMFNALYLCEFIYLKQSTYREASRRIINYFLTKPTFKGGADRERKKFEEVMNKDFKIMDRLKEIGEDYMCYGNAFCSIFLPFTRVLRCKECSSEVNIKDTDFTFGMEDFSFKRHCDKCAKTTVHSLRDFPCRDPKKIKLVRWDPKLVTIEHNFVSGEANYWVDIPAEVKAKVKGGDKFLISTLPLSMLVAIKRDQKYKLKPEYFYHIKDSSLSGVRLSGWGVPSILTAFPQFFRLQVLYRYDEVLMMDYIVPLRLLSPRQAPYQDGNTILMSSMANWTSKMSDMIQRHRQDGADWNFVPFPIDYQAVGGEGRNLAPKDVIQMDEDRLLNARGIPPELFRGTLSLQSAPIALRLFERSWSGLVSGFNDIADWMNKTISRYLNSGDYTVELEPISITDDIEGRMWRLQAMTGGLIAKETALRPMGIDYREEYRRILDQQNYESREQEKAQQEAQMAHMNLDNEQQEGQEGQGGGGAAGQSPMDVEGQADQMARQLLQMPEQEKNRQLAALRQSNSTMHAVVLKKMDQLRNVARSQGMGQALGQVVQNAPLPPGGGQAPAQGP